MKALSFLLLFCGYFLVSFVECWDVPYRELWFTQRLDHFNAMNPQTFQQRYLVPDNQWKGCSKNVAACKTSSPYLFFYTGNEDDVVAFWDNTGFLFELAQAFSADVVFAEHRYYGKSYPFGLPHSFDRDKIGYLSVEQGLADFAELVAYLREQFGYTKVIAFGGSYGGMLSGWFRIAYPHLVDGALAASAPMLMASGYNPSPSYWQTVTNDFQAVNAKCPGIVRQGFSQVLTLANSGQYQQISDTFHLCSTLEANQVPLLILWIQNAFGTIAMGDYPYPTGFLGSLPAWPVNVSCSYLLQAAQPISGLAKVTELFYNNSNTQCHNITQEYIVCSDQTGCGDGPSGLSWDYQACTEVIYFPNTDNVTDMFPPRQWTLANLTQHCQKNWGPDLTPRPNWLKVLFGGANISTSSQIIFSNGLLDPWHGGGFLKSVSSSLPAIIIPLGAHHLDLRGSNPNDPVDVRAARQKEKDIIGVWLKT